MTKHSALWLQYLIKIAEAQKSLLGEAFELISVFIEKSTIAF